jgi:hypothetical protein
VRPFGSSVAIEALNGARNVESLDRFLGVWVSEGSAGPDACLGNVATRAQSSKMKAIHPRAASRRRTSQTAPPMSMPSMIAYRSAGTCLFSHHEVTPTKMASKLTAGGHCSLSNSRTCSLSTFSHCAPVPAFGLVSNNGRVPQVSFDGDV